MMKRIICAVAMVCIVHATTVSADELIVGDDAPEMELAGSDGKIYKLSDFKDKKAVIIAWFPKVFTGGCKVECESFRRSADDLGKFNVVLLAASCDPLERNTAFANALKVDYPILSDPDGKVATAYGIFGKLRKYSSRTTFIVGKDGKLLSIDRKVDVENHGRDLVEKLGELGVEMVE